MVAEISIMFLFSIIFGGFAYLAIKRTEDLLEMGWIKSSWKKSKFVIYFVKFWGWWVVIIITAIWVDLLF